MKKPLYSLLALLAVIILSSFAQQGEPSPSQLPVGSASVADFKGEVSIQSSQGVSASLQKGLIVEAESTIETGKGRILLNLQDGSQVLIKDHSRVVLRNPEQEKHFYLELLIGKIVAKVQKRLGNTPSFRMGTPTAVITVRGTRFSVEVNKKQRTFVEVYEGLVEVQGFAALGHAVMIRPGFFTNVQRDHEPEQPHEFLGGSEGGMQGTREASDGLEREGQQQSTGSRTGTQTTEHESDH